MSENFYIKPESIDATQTDNLVLSEEVQIPRPISFGGKKGLNKN